MSKTTEAVKAAGHTDEGHLYAIGWIAASIVTAAAVVAVWQIGM